MAMQVEVTFHWALFSHRIRPSPRSVNPASQVSIRTVPPVDDVPLVEPLGVTRGPQSTTECAYTVVHN